MPLPLLPSLAEIVSFIVTNCNLEPFIFGKNYLQHLLCHFQVQWSSHVNYQLSRNYMIRITFSVSFIISMVINYLQHFMLRIYTIPRLAHTAFFQCTYSILSYPYWK